MKTITPRSELQARREARAQEEGKAFLFRLVDVKAKIDGAPTTISVVFVTSGTTIYTVHSGNRCSCMDSQKRAIPGGFSCKHALAANAWLNNGEALEPAPEAAAAAATVNPADPFGPALTSLFNTEPPARAPRTYGVLPYRAINAQAAADREALWG